MEGSYPVYHGQQVVGQAHVSRRGVYYYIVCHLRLSGDVIFRVQIHSGDQWENLGIPVPEGGIFQLQKTIPTSRFHGGELRFSISPMHESVKGIFVPLCPEEPFAYLSRLHNARLQYRDGQPGIFLPE